MKKTHKILIIISIIAVLLVPMLYSSIYLNSIWNVYNNFGNVPVAFVNLDSAVTVNGIKYDMGNKLEESLKSNNSVGWKFVSESEAKNGVAASKYYAMIEIPKDFSQKIANSSQGIISVPEIIYEANEGKSFIFSQIALKVSTGLKAEISSEVQKEFSKVLVENLQNVKSSLKDASNATVTLKNGTTALVSVSSKIATSSNFAAAGTKYLTEGINELYTGSAELAKGLKAFSSAISTSNSSTTALVDGANSLSTSTSALANGANQLNTNLNSGLNALADAVGSAANGINQATTILTSEISTIETSNLSDSDKSKLIAAITAVQQINNADMNTNIVAPLRSASDSAAPLAQELNSLENGTSKLSTGVQQMASSIQDSSTTASKALAKLISGAEAIEKGNGNALSATNKLSTNLIKLSNGASNLNHGLEAADSVVSKLNSGLEIGYSKLNSNLKFNSTNMSTFIASPVTVKNTSINEVKYYGEGFAPYFMSLSLWIGTMLLNLIFTVLDKMKIKNNLIFKNYWTKFCAGASLAAIQAVILCLVLVKFLGVTAINYVVFYSFSMLIAIVFFSIMYGASNAIGILATPVMFILLLFQLAASGGTFPIETAPVFYRIVNHYIPMTYSVNALRLITSGMDITSLKHNILVLLLFMSILLVLGRLVALFLNTFKNKGIMNSNNEEALSAE